MRYRLNPEYQLNTRDIYYRMQRHFDKHEYWFVKFGTDDAHIEITPDLTEHQLTLFELLFPGMLLQEDPAVE